MNPILWFRRKENKKPTKSKWTLAILTRNQKESKPTWTVIVGIFIVLLLTFCLIMYFNAIP